MYDMGWTIIQQHTDSSKNIPVDDPCELCIIFRNQVFNGILTDILTTLEH